MGREALRSSFSAYAADAATASVAVEGSTVALAATHAPSSFLGVSAFPLFTAHAPVATEADQSQEVDARADATADLEAVVGGRVWRSG
jgi:hypothetical protein